jgi:hypothetical protein
MGNVTDFPAMTPLAGKKVNAYSCVCGWVYVGQGSDNLFSCLGCKRTLLLKRSSDRTTPDLAPENGALAGHTE